MSSMWDEMPDPWPEFNPLLDVSGIDPSDPRHYSDFDPYDGMHPDGAILLEDIALAGMPGACVLEVLLFCGRCTFVNNKGRKKPVRKPLGFLRAEADGWHIRSGDRDGRCPDARLTIACPECGFRAWISACESQLTDWFLSHPPTSWRKRQSLDYLVKKGLAQEEVDPWANPPVTTAPF